MKTSLKSFASFVVMFGISAAGASSTASAAGHGPSGGSGHASSSHVSSGQHGSGSSHNPGSHSKQSFDKHDSHKYDHDWDKHYGCGGIQLRLRPVELRFALLLSEVRLSVLSASATVPVAAASTFRNTVPRRAKSTARRRSATRSLATRTVRSIAIRRAPSTAAITASRAATAMAADRGGIGATITTRTAIAKSTGRVEGPHGLSETVAHRWQDSRRRRPQGQDGNQFDGQARQSHQRHVGWLAWRATVNGLRRRSDSCLS